MEPAVLATGCQHGLHLVERSKLFCADDTLVILIMVNRIIKFDVLRTPVTELSGKLIHTFGLRSANRVVGTAAFFGVAEQRPTSMVEPKTHIQKARTKPKAERRQREASLSRKFIALGWEKEITNPKQKCVNVCLKTVLKSAINERY